MTLIKMVSQKLLKLMKCSGVIDDYNIEANFQMGDAGSHPCVPGAGDLLPCHGDHEDHQRMS